MPLEFGKREQPAVRPRFEVWTEVWTEVWNWGATAVILAVAFIAVLAVHPLHAQEERRHKKVPGLDRITSGADHQAFSGTVQSLDLRHSILNVSTVQGGNTEVFPIKKGVHVETAKGGKLKLDELLPGTSVIIYYEQRGDRRNVREIVVLQSASAKDKKTPPSS
jgi:hypothetical protein